VTFDQVRIAVSVTNWKRAAAWAGLYGTSPCSPAIT
jgi:hypothetical protein